VSAISLSGKRVFRIKVLIGGTYLLFWALVLLGSVVWAGEDLRPRIDEILYKRVPKEAQFGLRVIQLFGPAGDSYGPQGKVLYSFQANELFAAASNTKLFATAAALARLGPDYEFKTRIYARGKINNGVLEGDLIILGSGDPNISGRFHKGDALAIPRQWARAIRDSGIKKVTGSIIADDRFFDRISINPHWSRQELTYWYAAPISALSFNDNCLGLTVTPVKPRGMWARVLKSPNTSYVNIIKTPRVIAKGRASLELHRRPRTNEVAVIGKIPAKSSPISLWVTVHNPPLYLGTVLKEALGRFGVKVLGRPRLVRKSEQIDYQELTLITEHKSTLAQSIKIANKRSQNFYAEQILKTLGKEVKGEGSWPAGLSAVAHFLAELGMEPGSYRMVDGSGLARGNRFSPMQVTTLLELMAAHPHAKVWKESLSRAGVDGTLRNRLRTPPYEGRVLGKTGTAGGISALSGYVLTTSGHTLAFSFLFNDFEGSSRPIKAIEDEILQVLVEWRP
jgi:D-alanyl-D-alanine carboxypeptidase/D-alanyl-D-alanine-endopeptidase (penicillin-binding protein 4)